MESSDTSDGDVFAFAIANVRHIRALVALAVQGADVLTRCLHSDTSAGLQHGCGCRLG